MKQLHFEQVSVLTAPYLHHTLEYALDSIAANGFHGVELWGASPHFCIDDYTPEERAARIRDIRQMLKDRDLRLTAFQPEQCRQYPINIASPIAYVRERSMQFMERYLEDTLDLGTDRMILAPGWGYVDAPEEEAFARSVEAIRRLAEKAAALGVKLSVEEMDPLSTLLVRDLPHLKKLLDAVGSTRPAWIPSWRLTIRKPWSSIMRPLARSAMCIFQGMAERAIWYRERVIRRCWKNS